MGSVGNTATQASVLASARTLNDYIAEERLKKQTEAGVSEKWKDNKMYTYDIDGKQITTNLGAYNYPFWNGNSSAPYVHVDSRTTDSEVLKSLIERGYTKIQFRYRTTAVRGYHETYAFYS